MMSHLKFLILATDNSITGYNEFYVLRLDEGENKKRIEVQQSILYFYKPN